MNDPEMTNAGLESARIATKADPYVKLALEMLGYNWSFKMANLGQTPKETTRNTMADDKAAKAAADRQAQLDADNKARIQWDKDHPNGPGYVSKIHLTPAEQSVRDAQRQEEARLDKQNQAKMNNEDQARRQVKANEAEAADYQKTSDELAQEDAARVKNFDGGDKGHP